MMRDNMAPLLAVSERLGVDARRYTWLRWPTNERGSNSEKVFMKYKEWIGDVDTMTWEEQLSHCDEQCVHSL
jgi:hypothetical protein